MSQQYFIGVDIGTTSTKAIVFSQLGAIRGIANRGYPILSPQLSWAEQDPEVIFSTVIAAVREAVDKASAQKSDIAAVGFSSAMHSLIAIDAKHHPLTKSIIWADNRSVAQAERLKQDPIGSKLYSRTGTPIHPMSPLTKLMWMREANPEIFEQAAKFISIKEYILYQLFNCYVVDYSIASTTGLLNLAQLDWDSEALRIAGIHRDQLSELVPTTHILQGMKIRHAEDMGLFADTPVVIGASDGALANLGVGAIAPGQLAITIGTSGAVRAVVPNPITDDQGRTFCYALTPQHWLIGGPSNSGGIILRWFRDNFGMVEAAEAKRQGLDAYELMIQAALNVPAGAEGLICLPFLSGERSPHWNANARGTFFGVGLHHQRPHFIRAVLEGILFSVYSINVALQDLAGDNHTILASGGFARSKDWRQMMADVFGKEVLMPEVYEASGFGAAVLAMYAIGTIPNLEAVEKLIRITDRHQPNPQLSQTYQELFALYERLYQQVAPEFAQIVQYQR